MNKYKILDHTADIGIEVWGKTKKELFGDAVEAMFDLMIDKEPDGKRFLPAVNLKVTRKMAALEEKVVNIKGADTEDLLVNFLREALYLFNGKRWFVKKCKLLELTARHVVAQLQGESYNSQKHQLEKEIKAVTYHGLSVKKTAQGWKAKVIFDV
jgi:SHS2 domain-containing protein